MTTDSLNRLIRFGPVTASYTMKHMIETAQVTRVSSSGHLDALILFRHSAEFACSLR